MKYNLSFEVRPFDWRIFRHLEIPKMTEAIVRPTARRTYNPIIDQRFSPNPWLFRGNWDTGR